MRRILGIALVLAILFVLRTPRITADGLQYCLDSRSGADFFHPHHLLTTPAIHFVHAVLNAVGIAADEILAGRIHSLFFTAVLGLSFLALLRSVFGKDAVSPFEPLALVFTYGVATFASQPESYTASLACLVLAFYVVSQEGRLRHGLVAALLLALAVLYHQLAVLSGLPLLGYGLFRRERRGVVLVCLTVSASLVLLAYVAAHRASSSPQSLVEFALHYSKNGLPGWGEEANFGSRGIASFGNSILHSVTGALPNGESRGRGIVVVLVLALLIGANAIEFLRRRERNAVADPAMRGASIVAVIVYSIFLVWWIPALSKYELYLLPHLYLLARFLAIDHASPEPLRRRVPFAVLAFAGTIVLARLLPEHLEPHVPRERAARLARVGGPGTIRICDFETANFLRYDHGDALVMPAQVILYCAYNGTFERVKGRIADPLSNASTIVIPLSELAPTYEAYGRNADSNPAAWRQFALWLFDLRAGGSPQGAGTRRAFEVESLEGGEFVVVMSQDRVATKGLAEVFEALDAKIAARSADPSLVRFRVWDERVRMARH